MGKKTGSYICGHCKKQGFSIQSMRQHVRDAHKGKIVKIFSPCETIDLRDQCEREPSMAELTLEAELNKNMGLPYEGWLLGE